MQTIALNSPVDSKLNTSAEAAAQINAQNNKLVAKACAIFAKSSTDWRQNVVKVRGIFVDCISAFIDRQKMLINILTGADS